MVKELYEEINCKTVKKQMLVDEHIYLEGKVLILSDRLTHLAIALSEYIKNITDAEVIGVAFNGNDIMEFTKQEIDYLIILGYLNDEYTYASVNKLYSINKDIKIIKWALLDDLINEICYKYKIKYKYNRYEPLKNFMQYLIDIKRDS